MSDENSHTKIIVLHGVQISIDGMMTKDNKHRVVDAVSRVANGSQWRISNRHIQ